MVSTMKEQDLQDMSQQSDRRASNRIGFRGAREGARGRL